MALKNEEIEKRLDDMESDFNTYKESNDLRTKEMDIKIAELQQQTIELSLLVNKRSSEIVKPIASTPVPDEAVVGELLAEADNIDQYGKNFLSNGLFVNTNGYAFTTDNGNPPNAFIRIYRSMRDLIFKFSRDAEGVTTEHNQSTNDFVAAHPLVCVGAQNGREVSHEPTAKLLSETVKRQYDYPAYDLEQCNSRVGLPSRLKDLWELRIKGRSKGKFYVFNSFFDMYLHDLLAELALQGYRGTLNAIDGNFTKSININMWFVKPDKVNARGLANGWTGAIDLKKWVRLDGIMFRIGLKHETVNSNSFLYVTLIPEEDITELDFNLMSVIDWSTGSMWEYITSEEIAKDLINSMPNPPKRPTEDNTALCSLNWGPEVWYTKAGSIETFEIQDFSYTVNGVTRYIDGSIEGEHGGKAPDVVKQEPEPQQREPEPTQTEDVIFNNWQDIKMSIAGWEVSGGNNPNVFQIKKNSPVMVIKAKRKGSTILTWKDSEGNLYKTKIRVK